MKLMIQLLEYARYMGFLCSDLLHGCVIQKHLKEIKTVLEQSQSAKAIEIRQNHLKALMNHAHTTTKFYNEIKIIKNLSDFPVINKNILNNNKSDFLSSKFINKKNQTVSTSGSTGATLTVIQDKNKRQRNTADTIYFSKQAGFKIGNQLLFLRHWNQYYKKPAYQNWLQNISPIEVLDLNDTYIENLIKKMESNPSAKGLLGFPSAFEQICQYLDTIKSKPIDGNIKSIIGMAEALNENTKSRMQKYFKAPMVSRYSNMENGIMAQQMPNAGSHFNINWASYHIEILDFDKDVPVEAGQPGRIVVTDLFNYAMPLLRYDTGDIGIIEQANSLPFFKKIEGRKTDILFDTTGNIVSPFIMTNLSNVKGIKQGQLIQEAKKEYTLKLNTIENFDLEVETVKIFRGFLGIDAIIKVVYVNDIPLLASGKRKVTINNYTLK